MEILIRLAGVQLGPYSEEQVRQHLSEGLLSATDSAKHEGMEDWAPLGEVLAKLPPPDDAPPEPASGEVSEAPKRAPSAPPGVTHLPARQHDSSALRPASGVLAGKTALIGPTAPTAPSPAGHGAPPIVTTSPLASAQQGTKKVARASLANALAQKTAPLPTKSLIPPIKSPPPSPASQPDAKQESLMKALTAKTVPMRSVPASPASPPPTLPVTAPLPNKPVFKPASGAVPPPSVVKALTKKLGRAGLPDSAQPSSSTPGSPEEVETTKLPSPQTKAGEKSEALIPVEPLDESSAPSAPKRIMPRLIYACAALALFMLYYVWSPYHAAASLRNALDDGDPAELDAAIDFLSVRASLKEQITQSSTGPAASAVLSMMDDSIDLYVTPEGIAGLIKRPDQFSKEEQAQTVSPETAARIFLAFNGLPVRNQGLASPGDFVLDRDAVMLHLQFQGMGWKLKRVDLRPDLLLPGPSGSAAPMLSPVVDTYLERGDAKSKQGDWKGAIADFTQVLAIDPQSSAAYNDRGAVRQSKGDLDGAIKDYTQALVIDPQMAAAYNGRGNVKSARNDLDGAVADYTQAVRIDPTMAVAYDSRGNARTAKDDLDGAISDFTQAIAIDPNLASAYSDRGFARQANGNFDGAISDYTQALALKPKTASAYYNRGLARLSQGNLNAAIVDFNHALDFDPKIAEAYYYRGNAKSATHDLDGAIADFTQAVTLNPKIALAYCNRGLAHQAKGDIAGAVADYTQALAIDPNIAIAYYNRGLIETQQNNLDGAIADSSQALYLDSKNALAYYIRGFAKLAKGNLDGALADLEQFCDLAPRDHDADHARLYLWLISKAQNAKTDSDQELSDALENSWNSSPDDMISKTASFLLGRLNEADYLAAAVSPDAKTDQSQHCETWYFAGMKRLLTGDRKGAVDAFHQCLATGQKDSYEYILAQGELQALEAPPPPPVAPPPAAPATPATPAATGPAKSP